MKKSTTMKVLAFVLLSLVFSSALYAGEQVAQNPEDFTLQGVNRDVKFTLSEAKGKYVVLHFLLKTECPICLTHTHTYPQRADEVPDTIHLFINPDDPEEIEKWFSKTTITEEKKQPTIYHDPGAKLAKQFNIPFGYEFHGETVHFPALIILNPEGKEVFRYLGKKTQDRFPFDQFREKMQELQKS